MKMRRAIFVGGLLALLACMATPLSTPAAESAPAEAKGDASALRFRRIYLPEDRLDQWPRGDVRYLPLDATEFERMVARLQHGWASAAPPAAEIARATYSARLSGNSLVEGKATLEVRCAAVLTSVAPARSLRTGDPNTALVAE